MALAGPGASSSRSRAPPSRADTECRSSGSKWTSVPGARLDGLAAGSDRHGAVDDEEPRVLLDLVVAELLSRLEPDQHRAARFLGVEDDR